MSIAPSSKSFNTALLVPAAGAEPNESSSKKAIEGAERAAGELQRILKEGVQQASSAHAPRSLAPLPSPQPAPATISASAAAHAAAQQHLLHSASPSALATPQVTETQSKQKISDQQDLRQRLTKFVTQRLSRIIQDTFQRMEACSADVTSLNAGIFQASDYINKLKQLKEIAAKQQPQQNNAAVRYQELRKSNACYVGLVNLSFFDLADEFDLKDRGYFYNLKNKVKFSKALASLRKEVTFLQHANVIVLVCYEAILEIMGKTAFDTFFTSNKNKQLSLSFDDPFFFMHIIQKTSLTLEQVKEGDIVQFILNTELFKLAPKEFTDFFTICTKAAQEGVPPKFIGPGLPLAGVTLDEITERFYQEYMKPPIDPGLLFSPAHVAKHQLKMPKKKPALTLAQFKNPKGNQSVLYKVFTFNLAWLNTLASYKDHSQAKLMQLIAAEQADEKAELAAALRKQNASNSNNNGLTALPQSRITHPVDRD